MSVLIDLKAFIVSRLISMMNFIYKNISLAGADLPDDDYTTLVPHSKPVNTNSQNTSKIQIIIDDKENNATPTQSKKSVISYVFLFTFK